MKTLVRFLVLLATPISAFAVAAVDAIALPEPETFSLFAIGAVALLATTLRKKK